jgi:hypothetical protein
MEIPNIGEFCSLGNGITLENPLRTCPRELRYNHCVLRTKIFPTSLSLLISGSHHPTKFLFLAHSHKTYKLGDYIQDFEYEDYCLQLITIGK